MAEEEYNKKLEALQGYIPFLNNMISQLKDPNKKNREQQLSKMESLHAMITDRKKKLKLETLNKCEDVISKLYLKVNHKPFQSKLDDNPASPPPNSKDYFDIKPISIPTERLKSESRIPKVDVYSSAAESLKKAKSYEKKPDLDKLHDFSKPPISLDDLKCLEVDVQEKINETASLKELNDIRNKIATELIFEKIKSMNPTKVDSNPNYEKTNVHNNDSFSEHKAANSQKKFSTKVIKEPSSIFGSILSNIDAQVQGEKKKKNERRNSKEDKTDKSNGQSKEKKHSKESKKSRDINLSGKKHFQEKVSTVLANAITEKASNDEKSFKKVESAAKCIDDKGNVLVKNDPRNAKNQPTIDNHNLEKKIETKPTQPAYKRLADKYNPKPRKSTVDADVDKVVADSIEQNMIKSPPKIPLINRLTELPPPPPASLVKCSQLEPEYSHQLKQPLVSPMMHNKNTRGPPLPSPRSNNITLTPPILSLQRDNFISPPNPSVLMSPRDNFSTGVSNSIPMSPRDTFSTGVSNSIPMSPRDNFVSDYAREDFNFINQRRPHYESPPSLLSLNRIMPPTVNPRFNPSFNNYNSNRFDAASKLEFQPLNHIPSHNQYNVIPPVLSPEVPHFQDQKPYGMVNREPYVPKDDLRWRLEDSRPWDRREYDTRFRGPTTYKEHREIRENSRDPRVTRDTREIRERESRDIRDPRLNRDTFNMKDRETKEKESTEKDNKDPRLNKDSNRGQPNTRENIKVNRYESKFDRLYSRTNKDRSPSRSPSGTRTTIKENDDKFASPLDSLYANKEENKTGKGYGVQCFRIPKKRKDEKEQVEIMKEKNDEKDVIISECDSSQNIEFFNDDSINTESTKSIEDNEHKTVPHTQIVETEDSVTKTIPLSEEISESMDVESEIYQSKKEPEIKTSLNEKPNQSVVQNDVGPNVYLKSDNSIAETSKIEEPSNPPAEQRILAQFFANLLGSNDKKEKKTALYSLISTFSDTFSSKELSKITKIIKTNEDESSEEDESPKKDFKIEESKDDNLEKSKGDDKLEVTKEDREFEATKEKDDTKYDESKENVKEQEKVDDVETEEIMTETIPKRKLRSRRISSVSPTKHDIQEVTNSGETIDENFKLTDNSEVLQKTVDENNEVLVSVGERIKSRKRTATLGDKPKKKCRSELDKLHEDIQEMFIRDGVLTASGKRMCHLLKDDPSVLDTGGIDTNVEEIVKIRKKPGPKPKIKPPTGPTANDVRTMKTVRVIIHKIPDVTMEESGSNRRLTRSMTNPESDEESSVATEISTKELSDFEDNTYSESDQECSSQPSDNIHKIKLQKRKRPRSNWASGIIRKKKKKQSNEESQQKSPEPEEPSAKEIFMTPEKDHYVDFKNKKSYECRLCDFHGRYIASHYKIAHPESEVMCSRFTPFIANEALADAKMNMTKYEKYQMTKPSAKIAYSCRFCTFSTNVIPTVFYDHITTHTGEYRHICPNCGISFCSGKTLKVHMTNNHKGEEKIIVRKSYNSVIIFGYICGECNYVQMNKNNIEEHINIYHLLRPSIHKVNMTAIFDEAIIKLFNDRNRTRLTNKESDVSLTCTKPNEGTTGIENNSLETVNKEVESSPARKKPKLKPGPKSKKKLHVINPPSNITEFDSAKKDVDPNKVNAVRRSIDDIDPTKILPFRSKRAAKEKAQEKLKELMEINDNVSKKKITIDDKKVHTESSPKETDENRSSEKTENVTTQESTVTKLSENVNEPFEQIKREIDMNVFTCKTDIQEENKKIELERLLKMDELNKSVGSRTSLNFIDKLCNRLNQNEVIVKQEPNDDFIDTVHQTLRINSPISMPVLEKNPATIKVAALQIKNPILETETHVSTPTFDVSQKNDKSIVDMIEKLKGKLGADDNFNIESNHDEEYEGPPPLTHVNELTNIRPFDASIKTLEICGLIKLIKTEGSIMFCCLVPPCVFSTENKEQFQIHCKEHHSSATLRNSTLCESCGLQIISEPDTNLLENLFKHTITQHADFLDSNFKPPTRMLRLRKLSGDALSVVKNEKEQVGSENEVDNKTNTHSDSFERSIHSINTNITNDIVEDNNPFPFKISGVMSLADPEPQPPPLAPIMKSNMQIVVKEAKLTSAELTKPKKTQKAIKKFIEEVGKLYKCPHYYCLFTTNFREFLEKHLKAHNSEKDSMVPCVYCDLKTPWEHVAVHIDIRHGSCKYACSYCLYRACLKDYVILHQDREHSAQDYSVIVLPIPKVHKKFAIADAKIDPKTLCNPYICQTNCNMQFLFENEFREHVTSVHHLNTFITCGHEHCSSRIKPSKIVQHWSAAHDVSVYQCGYCKTNSNELQAMYHHLSKVHQNLNPEILFRLVTPKPSIILGYTTEAFRKMRKIATIPSVTDGEKAIIITPAAASPDAPSTVNHFTNTTQVATTAPSTKTVFIPSSASTITTSANNLFLVTTTSTGANSLLKVNSMSPPSLVHISQDSSQKPVSPTVNSTAVESSKPDLPVDPLEFEEPSLPASAPEESIVERPNIPWLQTIETQNKNCSADTNLPEDTTKNSCTFERSRTSQNMVPLEHVNLNEDNNRDDSGECDIDPLDLGESLNSQSIGYSSEDESDNAKSDKSKKRCGLLGYQLFRCAFCDFSCSNTNDFKRHISKSVQCKSDNRHKPFMCVHCKKQFKYHHALGEHIQCHGILRYTCSLCGSKFSSPSQARSHMKNRHNISQTTQTTLNAEDVSLSNQEYIIKPKFLLTELPSKDNALVEPASPVSGSELIYLPDEINKIPMRSIFSSDLRCGVCSYTTKVRTNMVRHLQFHSEEKSVPDTAPVNPVPCLEKNEKMFDKMINLASSSHSSGSRMGGTNKSDVKDTTTVNIPEFVPSHNRYTCCAQDCSYICPEEANLRHHLIALHSEDTSFVCVHCKVKLTSTDADGLIKHLKLHGLQLYKCHYCDFVNNLKYRVEKHCNDIHNDVQLKTITVRCMESEPKYSDDDDDVKNSTLTPISNQNKFNRPWRCCMCKTRSATQEGINNHVLEKHDIDSQYKCALCVYKTNDKSTFTEHFIQEHYNQDINIVHVYRKIEDEPKEDKESDSFDTTPLWQRDRPRVRHIRGILFDEASPVTSKSSKKPLKPPPSISTSAMKCSTNLDLSINAVATGNDDVLGNNNVIENDEKYLTDQENKRSNTSDIIVIDDDVEILNKEPVIKTSSKIQLLDVKENTDIQMEQNVNGSGENEYSEINLIKLFGDFGQPLHKQLKCPVCNKFKSKRISDFIFHLFKEKKVYRFKCGICGDESITYKYMAKHVKEHKNELDLNNIITMPRNPKLEIWLQMLIRIQCVKIIASLSAPVDTASGDKHTVLCRYCNKWYKNEQERNEHAIFHWNCVPYKCSVCNFNSFTRSHMVNHFNAAHISGKVPNIVEAGPTVTSELQYSDLLHIKEIDEEINKTKSAAQTFKKTSIAEVLVPEVIIPDMIDESEQDGTVQGMSCQVMESSETNHEPIDNIDDLVMVTKTDTNVPRAGDVFCCEYCPYMFDSEMLIVSHISSQHEHMHIKFKILNQDKCESKLEDYVACVICSEIGSEIKIRQHHLELHIGETFGIYRYICCSCQKRFFKMNGLKMHFQRIHPGVPVKYVSILDSLENSQLEKSKSDSSVHGKTAIPSLVTSQKVWKHYQCTECSYERDFTGSSVGNVRSHMRNHFRAFVCKDCDANFRSKTDALSHCRKEHGQSADNIIHAQYIEDRFQSALRTVLDKAVIVPDPDNLNRASINSNPSQSPTKQTARKSTSTTSVLPMDEYSFYGQSIENVDLNKIMTSVEMNGVYLHMTADKLGKIFDLNPFVCLEKCDTLPNDIAINLDS